jgi:hypothetical protein
VEVVGTSAHRQGIEPAPARPAVEQGGRVDGVGIEQVEDGAYGSLKVGKSVVVRPYLPADISAIQKVGRAPDRERRLGFIEDFILCGLDELDPLAGVLLERGDDLPDRLVLLGVEALLPPLTRSAAFAPSGARTSAAVRTRIRLHIIVSP